MDSKSICFVSRNAHYVLLDETDKRIGGAEFQQAVIAKALSARGWNISFITEKSNKKNISSINNIRIIASLDYCKGNRYLRRILWIPIRLWKLLNLADAQVYYLRNPGPFASIVALFCKLKKRRFVLAGANDANFHKGQELNVNTKLDVLDINLSIRFADLIILQSQQQKKLLRKYFGKDGKVFFNVYAPPPGYSSIPSRSSSLDKKILWVGRIADQKRPLLCLELARLLPEFEIVMVGAFGQSDQLYKSIQSAAEEIPNIKFLGHLPLPEVEALFDTAYGLINTSYVEGFPNTFLQAWSRGLPVFSFVDPDNLIKDNGLGGQVNSIDRMSSLIRDMWPDEESFLNRARRIISFFNENFLITSRIEELEDLFVTLI